MLLNSIFSGITRGSSILGLATTATSATVGSITAYYLFKGDDTKEKLKQLNSDLEETKKGFEIIRREIRSKGFEQRFPLARQQVTLTQRNDCLKREMKSHDEQYGAFGSWYTPKLDGCRKRHVIEEQA